jgi:hypothetical protein
MFMGTENKEQEERSRRMSQRMMGNEYYRLRSKDGRDRLFSTPDDLWMACCEYFQWVKDNPMTEEKIFRTKGGLSREDIYHDRAMTLAGLRVYIGLSASGYQVYQKKDEYQWVTNAVRDIMYSQKFEGAASGFFKENLIARELGLKDKKEISGDQNAPISTVRIDPVEYAKVRKQMLEEDDC